MQQDFKEAARLSAEAKAVAVQVEALTAEVKAVKDQLTSLDAQEQGLAEQLKELRAMLQVGRGHKLYTHHMCYTDCVVGSCWRAI